MKYFNLFYILVIILSLSLISSGKQPEKSQTTQKASTTKKRPNLSVVSPLV
uniref:SP2.5 n=1 Tax=Phlebotomus papatasi TaxID=29031 RepID=M1J7S9_PHLPP|nr:SP2.5 [Phlebotomus papatasi]